MPLIGLTSTYTVYKCVSRRPSKIVSWHFLTALKLEMFRHRTILGGQYAAHTTLTQLTLNGGARDCD